MKRWTMAAILGVALVVAAAAPAPADQLPAPLERTVMPGVTTIQYAGQSLRFTTDVPLRVKLVMLDAGRIRLEFRAHASSGGPEGTAPSDATVDVFWENWSNDIYSGPAPATPWAGILLTESGFTEK